MEDVLRLSPLWFSTLVFFIPLTVKTASGKELQASISSLIAGIALIGSFTLFALFGGVEKVLFSLEFSKYNQASCLLVNLSGIICLVLFHLNKWLDERQRSEILFFFGLGLVGLYVFLLAQDLLTAFVGLELASLSLYLNISMSRKDSLSLEAAIKYFILSAFSGVCFLYGLSFLYGSTGTLNLSQFFLEDINSFNRFFFLGWAFVFAGLFSKAAFFPFQFWLPDVYQGALTPMSSFLATGVKASLILFLGKVFSLPFFEEESHGSLFLLGLAGFSVLTVLFGSLMALKQVYLKRLLAFSSLTHGGYLMMALFAILSLSEKDFSPLFYYLLAYIPLTGGLFLLSQGFEKKDPQVLISNLKGLFFVKKDLAFLISVFLLGLAGLPPTFAFFAKVGVFSLLIGLGSWWLLFWAFVASAIGLYYYMRPLVLMTEERQEKTDVHWGWLARGVGLILAFISIFGAFLSSLLFI